MNGNANLVMSSDRRAAVRRRHAAGVLDRVLLGAAAGALLLTAASWLAETSWLLELLTHFRLQFAGGGILILAFALLRRQAATIGIAGLVAAANGAFLVPYVMPGTPAAEAATQETVRIMGVNVRYGNADYAAVREAVRHEDPDVVGLVEVTEKWAQELEDLREEYPFAIVRSEEGAFGLALFSRLPLDEAAISPYIEDGTQAAIFVDLMLQETPVTLVLSHLRAPTGPANAKLRNRQLLRIAELVNTDPNGEQILLGDLNTTPWSPDYRAFEAAAGLSNAARGRGYLSTWPTWLPGALLRIPIDHCLLSDGLRVQQLRTGGDVGSDHLPIVADIALVEPVSGESI